MMPEQAAKQRATVKPKLSAAKTAVAENGSSNKCPPEQKSQPTPASVSRNVPVFTAKEKPKTDENVPAPALPRIVIKIHQGRIVSPSAITSPSSSSVKKHNAEYNRSGTTDSQEGKATDSTHRTEKSDRLKTQSLSKPTKMVFGSKSDPKIASQSTSSKLLADRNSTAAYYDSSQLQDSGSFDKLSLDCCMKLYSQLSQPPRASQPLQSSEHSSTSKSRHKTSSDRIARSSNPKKRSVDQKKQSSCVAERLPKTQAVGYSGNSIKVSASRPPSCTVQLNRIKYVNDFGSAHHHQGNSSVQLKSTAERCDRERQSDCTAYDSGAGGGADNMADDGCSVTLMPRSHGTIQQSGVPTATETVPGSSVPLSKPRRTFSKRSHTPMDSNSSSSGSPKKSRPAEIASCSNSSEKSRTELSSGLNSSVNDKCKPAAVKQSEIVSSEVDATRLPSSTDDDSLCRSYGVSSAAMDCVKIRNSKSFELELADGRVSDGKCGIGTETSAGRKRCNGEDSGSSRTVSKSKKSRMLRPTGEVSAPMSAEPLASDAVDETSDGNPVRCPSLSRAIPGDAVSQNAELPSISELLSSDEEQISPSSSDQSAAESSSSSPLRLRIRRMADVSPVREIYNVIGQDTTSDSTPVAACSTYQP